MKVWRALSPPTGALEGQSLNLNLGYASLSSQDIAGKRYRKILQKSRVSKEEPGIVERQQGSDAEQKREEDEIQGLRRQIRELEAKRDWRNRQAASASASPTHVRYQTEK